MAKIMSSLGVSQAKSVHGNPLQVLKSTAESSEKLTSAAGWASGTLQGKSGQIWNIVASGGAVEIKFALATPGAGNGDWIIPDGGSMPFSVTTPNETLWYRDA